ncbi:MAG TPA: CDP-glycerol glycerophosphotransferase family protein [Streptosporangiaceae bacterium]|nr:CDP-glycerol glycerophosphotransferase family protein [Streptosporangiaceae bacterium]
MTPKLSIVVPVHDVEQYLVQCLDSLVAQTFGDFEAIMVDDGSTDDSAVIAKSYAGKDPRFRLVRQANQGPGPARNLGVGQARGEYLAFVDGDDLVTRYAYEQLIGSLERTGSDLACGGVRRLTSVRSWPSMLHIEPFRAAAQATHVSRSPQLMKDRTVWNKVYRRTFWDAHGLAFRPGIYEDVPVAIRAHVLAGSVDVHRDPVYYWRVRDGGALSITQRRGELANIEARFAAIHEVRAFLTTCAPGNLAAFDTSVLNVDLPVAATAVREPYGQRVVELLGDLVDGMDPALPDALPALQRLRCHLMRQRERARLIEALDVDAGQAPVVRVGWLRPRWYADLPFRGDRAAAVPAEIYDVAAELTLGTKVTDITRNGPMLRIEGHAFIHRLDMTPASRIELWLEHAETGKRVPMALRRMISRDATANSHQAVARYDHAGFIAELDMTRLKDRGQWPPGEWRVQVAVRSGGLRRVGPLRGRRPGRAVWTPHWDPADDVRVQAVYDDGLIVRVKQIEAMVTGLRVRDGVAELSGWADPAGEGATLTVTRRKGVAQVTVDVQATGEREFTARLPLERLVADQGPVDSGALVADGVQWQAGLRLHRAAKRTRLTLADELPELAHAVGDREVVITHTRYGGLAILERSCRLTVSWVTLADGDRLVVSGTFPAADRRPAELILRRVSSTEEHRYPIGWSGRQFTVSLPLDVPLSTGIWNMLIGNGSVVVAERALLRRLPSIHRIARRVVSLNHVGDALQLKVRLDLPAGERGPYAQRRLKSIDYPALLRSPVRDLVVFDASGGRQLSGNPRAVFEEFRRRSPGHELVWVSRGGGFAEPDGARTVFWESRDHYAALAEARFVIADRSLPSWYRERSGQTYVQTVRGVPLKRTGFEAPLSPAAQAELAADVAKWGLLLSPNPFTTELLCRAYRYQGEVLECGSPASDRLLRADRAELAAGVRRRLGIPDGKRVVLYAPTWRENNRFGRGHWFDLRIDVDRARAALGSDHVLLIRGHPACGDTRRTFRDGFARDVTRYPDIADLYLVADVLVTDYSSAMFDFAHTGRPMIFFAYDLDRFRDEVRGFSFDYAPPGPVVTTSDELVGAIRDAAGFTGDHRAFLQRFCPEDDGRVSRRVVDRLLEG